MILDHLTFSLKPSARAVSALVGPTRTSLRTFLLLNIHPIRKDRFHTIVVLPFLVCHQMIVAPTIGVTMQLRTTWIGFEKIDERLVLT